MVPPRFLYVVRGMYQRPVVEEQSVGWRLIGSNHRELGRSAESFAGLTECWAAVLRLRERIADARVPLTTSQGGGWSWRLEIDGRAVAVAGRLYQRQRDCQYNVGQFLTAVPVAELTEPTPHRPRGAGGPRPYGAGRAPGTVPGPAARPGPRREEPDGDDHARSGDDGADVRHPARAGAR